MSKLCNEKNGNRSFFSLKAKWSIGTGIGVLVIFAVFSVMLFQSFSSLLMNQEKQYAEDSLRTAIGKLADNEGELTKQDVVKSLSLKITPSDNQNLYTNSVYTSLTRENIGISVYNLSGDLVFASRNVPVKFSSGSYQESRLAKGNSFLKIKETLAASGKEQEEKGTIAIATVFGDIHDIGKNIVKAMLENYDRTRQRLVIIFLVFGLTAAFALALLAYGLSSWLLRPVDDIHDVIGKITQGDESEALANVRVPEYNYKDELVELSEMFNGMLDRMERYVEQQQQFVEDVSHELRTPVAIIQGHLEMLNRWGKDDPKVLDNSIKASLQEINRMKSLVQEMLDLSRAEQVEIQFANEVTDVKEVGMLVYSNFKMIHPEFTFVMDCDLKEATKVQIYRNHLEQILIILMDNAVKYSTNRPEVHMSLAKTSRYAQIVVQDFGEGISQENASKIFDRFYRVDKARSRDKGGNGLGLAIAHRLIEGYHGKMTVESVLGQGSVFRISLPLIREEEKVIEEKESSL